tara:strand:- start:80 stop:679 length:600 start_codon:yes stop_codon:yes gene_type:complete
MSGTENEYHKKYYLEHKEDFLHSSRHRRQKRAEWFRRYKENLTCSKCEQGHHSFIEFHHTDPANKTNSVSKMVRQVRPEERILEEIAKCEILCANCHKKHHWKTLKKKRVSNLSNQVKLQRKRAEWFDQYKSGVKCKTCNESHPACLAFHHRQPEDKHMAVSKMVGCAYSVSRILAEIEKCDVLCANCHMKLHSGKESP